jgi:hypothetical protein
MVVCASRFCERKRCSSRSTMKRPNRNSLDFASTSVFMLVSGEPLTLNG